MLKLIAIALHDYNEKGTAVIVRADGYDPREVAEYVLSVLKDLKCSYDHYYNPVEDSYLIIDRMMEAD